jgi:hypothetical protein
MERAATPILGVRQYGIHINGMVEVGGNSSSSSSSSNTTTTSLWLQERSRTKQTFPGKLGTVVQLPMLGIRDVFPDLDFYPSRIPDPTTATKEEGEKTFLY